MTEKGGHRLIPPFSAVLIMVALSVVGIASIPRLNVQYTPAPTGRSIHVSYALRDASAEIIEAEATSLLEGVLSGIQGSTDISSLSKKGYGEITVGFRKGTNMEAARFEVASAIRNIYPSLPRGITYPEIEVESDESSAGNDYSIAYYLKGSAPSLEIDKYAREHILPALSAVKGVDGVALSGATPYQWVITFDAVKASTAGISGEEIARVFTSTFSDNVLGMVETGSGQMAVRLAGPASPDFGSIPVKNVDGTILYLRDLASWQYLESSPEYYYRVNGLNTIMLAITVAGSENMLSTVDAVKKEMVRLQSLFPDGISTAIAYDASDYVNRELRKIFLRTGLCLFILLLFVFLISRSWRYLLIITATLAVNILTAIAVYAFTGLQIHIYTLAGITVSLGIVIDTSVVMADHYGYWKNKKIFPAIFAATATTVGALLMVLLLPENARANLTDFIWIIIINLALSLAVAYFFIPSLMEFIPVRTAGLSTSVRRRRKAVRANHRYRRYIQWGVSHKWVLVLLFVLCFGIPTCLLPNPPGTTVPSTSTGAKRFFEQVASWAPYATNRDKIDKWMSSSFGLFYNALSRSNFYRSPERKQLYIQAGMLEGATVGQLNEVVKSMENYLAGFDEIESFTTSISGYDNALLVVRFKPAYEHTFFPRQLKNEVKVMAANFGGANWRVFGMDQDDFNNNVVRFYKSHSISLTGYNYQELYRYAEHLCSYLSNIRRVQEPEIWTSQYASPFTEFNLEYDFEAMTAAGISPYTYYGNLSTRLYGQRIGYVLQEGILTNVILQSSDQETYDLWHILHAPLQVDSTAITLSEVGSITKRPTGIDIRKKNQSYQMDVCFDFTGSYRLAEKTIEEAIDYMNGSVLPIGYKAENEAYQWYRVSKGQYAWLIFLIIAVIIVMLAMTFESLRYPLAVIFMIPISFIGLFLTFGLSNFSFDQGGFAALVMLCGIVVNAGIYLVTTYQRFGGATAVLSEVQIRRYVKAFNHKIIPIFLTITSTILGLLPFLSDGPEEVFWFDFAIGTIGGLAFSIIAVVIYLPVFVIKGQ